MQNLLRFLAVYYHFLIFVVLELLALSALVNFNNYHQSRYFAAVNNITGTIYQWQNDVTGYFNLRSENQILMQENLELRERDSVLNYASTLNDSVGVKDTTGRLLYSYRTAKVINNSIYKRRNYFTINKGTSQGLRRNMGVITPDGIAGKIVDVGRNYALAMSVLHEEFVITPKIGERTIYGGMRWLGEAPTELKIDKVSGHIPLASGDSVYTTSYSHFFPEGILIGTVSRVQATNANYQELWVELSNDIGQLSDVYVVENHYIEEILELEEGAENERD